MSDAVSDAKKGQCAKQVDWSVAMRMIIVEGRLSRG